MFPELRLPGEASTLHVPGQIPEYSPGRSGKGESQRTNNHQDVPSECHHASIYDSRRGSGRLASEEKVIFVLKPLGPILQFISADSTKRISKELKQATGEPPLIH